jgi:hypothetical protein
MATIQRTFSPTVWIVVLVVVLLILIAGMLYVAQ